MNFFEPKRILLFTAFAHLVIGYPYSVAQEKGTLELTMLAEQEVVVENEDGEKEIKREPISKVIPGDHIIYTIICKNIGEENADSVVINNPIPEQTQYVPGTAGGEDSEIVFSIDGGKTFDKPENLIVFDEEGNEQIATADKYTNVRWVLNGFIPPKGEAQFYYRVELK